MKNKFVSAVIIAVTVLFLANFTLAQKRGGQQEVVTLQNLDGSSFAIGDLKGSVTVLAIGATWLPLAKQQTVILNQLEQNYGKRSVRIYFVSTDASDAKSKNYADNAKLKSFAERNKLTTAILRDANGTTLKFANVDQIPAFVILNKNGEIATVVTGLDTDEESTKNTAAQISAALDKVL